MLFCASRQGKLNLNSVMDRREPSDNAPNESGGGSKKNDLLMQKARSVIDAVIALNKLGSDDEDSSRPPSPKVLGTNEYKTSASNNKSSGQASGNTQSSVTKLEAPPEAGAERHSAAIPKNKSCLEHDGDNFTTENTLYWLSENPSPEDFNGMTFPQKMHHVLKDDKHADIISWLPSGRSFVVRDQKRFAGDVIPKYFLKHIAYTSFTRRLARWGWQNIAKGTYFNKDFNRDNPGQCLLMSYNSAVSNKPSDQGMNHQGGGAGAPTKKNSRTAQDAFSKGNPRSVASASSNKRSNLEIALPSNSAHLQQQAIPGHMALHQQSSTGLDPQQQVSHAQNSPTHMHPPHQTMSLHSQIGMFHTALPNMTHSNDIFTTYANNNAGNLATMGQQQMQGNPSLPTRAPGSQGGFGTTAEAARGGSVNAQAHQPPYTFSNSHLVLNSSVGPGQPQNAPNVANTNHLSMHLQEAAPSGSTTTSLADNQADLSQKRVEMEQLQQRMAFEQQMQMHQAFFNNQNQHQMMQTHQFLQPQQHQHVAPQTQPQNNGGIQHPSFQAPQSANNNVNTAVSGPLGGVGDDLRHPMAQSVQHDPNQATVPGSANASTSHGGLTNVAMHQPLSVGEQNNLQPQNHQGGQNQMNNSSGGLFFQNPSA